MMENGASDPPRSQSPTDQLIIKNKKIKDVSFADGMSVSQDSLTTTTKDFSIRTLKSNIDSSTTICTTYSKKKVPDTFSKDKQINISKIKACVMHEMAIYSWESVGLSSDNATSN